MGEGGAYIEKSARAASNFEREINGPRRTTRGG